MMRKTTVLMACLALAACNGKSDQGASTSGGGPATIPPRVQKAATIANELEANPDGAKAILQKHGMTWEEYEALMYEISEDEALSQAYQNARGK